MARRMLSRGSFSNALHRQDTELLVPVIAAWASGYPFKVVRVLYLNSSVESFPASQARLAV
jgi:hypothetical protein